MIRERLWRCTLDGVEIVQDDMGYVRPIGLDQKVPLLLVAVLERFKRWFDEWPPGCHRYILFSPGRTADQRLPCAAASPAGCAQSFSELGVFGRVCLFAVDENQHSQTMCDLMIGNDHGW